METLYRIDINLFSALALFLVSSIAFRRLDHRERLNRAFFFTSLVIIGELLVEAGTCWINGVPGTGIRVLSSVLHVFLFLGAPFLTTYWFLLLCQVVLPLNNNSKLLRVVILVPQMANFLIVILSPWLGWVFSLDAENIYQRGPLFLVSWIVTYSFLAISVGVILRHRKRMSLWNISLLLLACVLPLLGGFVQATLYGILTMWPSVAMALIILYLFLQERLIHLDGLTGAWNRESFEHYINERIRLHPDQPFGALYFDLDHLKSINDRFGHPEGDVALQESVNLVRAAIGPEDVIARMGGDEFVVIVHTEDPGKLESVRHAIFEKLGHYNRQSGKPYPIGLSAGSGMYGPHFSSIEHFIHQLDQRMYEAKRLKDFPETIKKA